MLPISIGQGRPDPPPHRPAGRLPFPPALPFHNLPDVAWGPDEPHVPPPTPPTAPDGLAGFSPKRGAPAPRGFGAITSHATMTPREPLADFLSSFPGMKPSTPFGSQGGHMQATARRANNDAGRKSLLRDYLATA